MKLLVFSISICFATAQYVPSDTESKYEVREKEAKAECIRELNLDENKYNQTITSEKYDEYLKNPDDELICLSACVARKLVNKDLSGADNKTTLYNGISKLIEISIKAGFETAEFTNEDLVTKVESCNKSAQSECEFFKCSEMQHRLLSLMLYNYIFKVKDTVFDSDE